MEELQETSLTVFSTIPPMLSFQEREPRQQAEEGKENPQTKTSNAVSKWELR